METEYELWWTGKDIPFHVDTWTYTDSFDSLERIQEQMQIYKKQDEEDGVHCWYKIIKITWVRHWEFVYEDM